MFYKLDSTKVSLKEMWDWGKKSPVNYLFSIILKVLRVQIPCSMDDANIETFQPFQVAEESLPPDVRQSFAPIQAELLGLGFHSPVFYSLSDGLHLTRIYHADYIAPGGQGFGRIHLRLWDKPQPPRRSLFTQIITAFTDHTFLISTAGKPDLTAPATCTVNRIVGATATNLWELHVQEFTRIAKPYYSISKPESLVWAIETSHAELRDFHLKRGVFKPMNETEKKQEVDDRQSMEQIQAAGLQHAEVLLELNRAQEQKTTSWGRVVLILAVSLVAFIVLGISSWGWEYLLILIPILFFHESGHYLAMKIFGYRNLRMFFIPLFGAAVTGRNYNVPGWKKVAVSLMGPVPGIALGALLGIVGMIMKKALLMKIAMLLMFINGFNLLPVLPLDGGWSMHAILFSRHYLLDIGFRVLTALAMVGLSMALKTTSLMYVGIASLVTLPITYKVAKVVDDLRQRGFAAASPDDQNIPTETAQAIITELKKTIPKGTTNKNLANMTLNVFETINAKPPSWAASLLFLFVHGFSFAVAIVLGAAFFIGQNKTLQGIFENAAFMPRTAYACGSTQVIRKEEANPAPQARVTLVTSFKLPSQAQKAFGDLQPAVSAGESLEKFGNTVMVSVAEDNEAERKSWFGRLQKLATNTFVDSTNYQASMSLVCVAKDETNAAMIETVLNEYFSGQNGTCLIAPWSPQDPRTGAEKQANELARHTYSRLLSANDSGFGSAETTALYKKISEARKQGDGATVTKLLEEQKTNREKAHQLALEKIRNDNADKADQEVVKLYEQYEPLDYTNSLKKELLTRMSERMGVCGSITNRQLAAPAIYSARSGSTTRNGLIINLYGVSFYRVFDGAPALAEWFCQQGCISIKYSISSQTFYESGDEND